MAYSKNRIILMRKAVEKQFKLLYRNRGCYVGSYFVVAGPLVRDNIYHDPVDKSGDAPTGIAILCHVSYRDAAIKVVKKLGWWKEDEALPILIYMPYYDTITPKKKDEIQVIADGTSENDYKAGTYVINEVKAYAADVGTAYVFNVSPKRVTI